MSLWLAPAPVSGHHQPPPAGGRQRSDRRVRDLQVIGGGVAPGAAAAQLAGQRLGGVVAVGQQRVVAEALVIRLRELLAGEQAVTTEASSRMHVTCSRVLSAMRIPGRAPWRAAAAAHARRRAVFTAAVTRVSGRLPPAAISFSARQQVGTDATLRGDKISGLRIYFPMSLLIEQLTG